jgi:hypothetical protein
MIELSVVRDLVAIFGVIAGLSYYIFTVRNQERSRQAQLFISIYNNHISTPTMSITLEMLMEWEWEDFDDFLNKYALPNNREAMVKMSHYFASLEGMGILCKNGLINPELVYDSQYATIIAMWEKFLPVIEEMRINLKAPQMYEDPEYLYNEMVQMRAKRGHPDTYTRDIFTKRP